ncbi:MAG: hypothetical protein QM296_00865 [Bacillota bacterium]|nr:hypothetical protein [Bacillota bacterium]
MTRKKKENKDFSGTAERHFYCRELSPGYRLSSWELDWLQGPQQLFLRPWPAQGRNGESWLLYDRSACLSFDEVLARRKLGFDDFLGLLLILCRHILHSVDQLLDPGNIDVSRDSLFFLRPWQDLDRVPLEELFAGVRLLYLPVGPETVGLEAVRPEAIRPEAVGLETVRPEAVGSETVGPEEPDPAAAHNCENTADGIFFLWGDEAAAGSPSDGSAVLAHLVEDMLQNCFPEDEPRRRELLGRCYGDLASFLVWLDEEVRRPAKRRWPGTAGRKRQRKQRRPHNPPDTRVHSRGGQHRKTRFGLPLAALFVLQFLLLAGIQQLIRLYAMGASIALAVVAAVLLITLIVLDLVLLLRPELQNDDETAYQRRQRLAAAEARRREERRRLERALAAEAEAEAGAADSEPVFACLYDVTGDGDYQMISSPGNRAQRFNADDFMRRRVPLAVLMHNSCYLGSEAGRADIVVESQGLEAVRLRFRRLDGRYRLCDLGGDGEIRLDGRAMPAGEEQILGSRHEIGIGDSKLLYLAPITARTADGYG